MEANKGYDMFKFLLKVLAGLIIQTKLALDCSQSPFSWDRLDIPRLIDFQMYRGGGRRGFIDLVGGGDEKFFASSQTASRPLSSFDTHPRWQPVTQSARSRRCYAKIEDCEQSKLAQTLCCLHVYLKVKWNVFWQGLSYVVLQQFREKKKARFDRRQKQTKRSHFKLL